NPISAVDPALQAKMKLAVQQRQEGMLSDYAKMPDEMKSNGKLSDFFAGASGLPAEYFPAAASHRLTQLGIQAGMSPEQAATSTDKQIQEYLTAWGKTPQGKAAGATATETAKQAVETSPTG